MSLNYCLLPGREFTGRLPEGLLLEEKMAAEIETKLNELIEALLQAGALAVGTPQLVELSKSEGGYLDIPMKVRVAV